MGYKSTETKLSVLAGNPAHVGTLAVGLGVVCIPTFGTGATEKPPYDYQADAEQVVQFLEQFLPKPTFDNVESILRSRGT